jgi:hypothetical protein
MPFSSCNFYLHHKPLEILVAPDEVSQPGLRLLEGLAADGALDALGVEAAGDPRPQVEVDKVAAEVEPGTDVMILKIFSQNGVLSQTKAKLCKNLIITFEKKPIFFAENCRKL